MLALLLLLGCFSTVAYAENSDRVVDNADLLTDAEEASLEEQYTQIAEKYQYDIAVVTTNTLNGKSAQDYADDYYYDNGYGYGRESGWSDASCEYGGSGLAHHDARKGRREFLQPGY